VVLKKLTNNNYLINYEDRGGVNIVPIKEV
jgi:hypothetical protein